MKKKLPALAAAIVMTLSLTACGLFDSPSDSSGGNSSNISDSAPSSTNNSSSSNNSGSASSSDSNTIKTTPLTVRCGDIIMENDKRTFDVEITCGNAFIVLYHYISSQSWRIENAIPSFKPLGMTSLKDILNDPQVRGSDLSESDFELIGGIYRMKDEEKAKAMLGSLTNSYSFDQYWKNQKMAELVSTEGISAEEAKPRVEEMFENMGNKNV